MAAAAEASHVPVVAGVIDDMLGNPVATVSASGRVDWNDCVVGGYGPQPGWTAPALSASAGPAKASVWRGRRFDPDTGYCWLGARFYDPAGHRYLSPDPLGHAASLGLYDYAGGDPVNFVDPDGRLVVGAAEGYVFGNWSSDIDSVDRPGRILGRAAGTMLGYMTPGYNVVAGYRDIAAGGFHFGRAIYDISVNGLNQETGIALAMSGLELAGGFAGTKMFGAARAGSSEMAFSSSWAHVRSSIDDFASSLGQSKQGGSPFYRLATDTSRRGSVTIPNPFGERGSIRSKHFSMSPEGVRLRQEAQAYRSRFPGTNAKKAYRNVVVADVVVDGQRRTVRFINDPSSKSFPGGYHSEQRLIEWADRMTKRGRNVKVERVYSDRMPCGPKRNDCSKNLSDEFGPDLEVFFFKHKGPM